MADRPIIVFDVDETLLNLESSRPTFDRIFNDPAAMRFSVDETVRRHKPSYRDPRRQAARVQAGTDGRDLRGDAREVEIKDCDRFM
jgi:FMN phosphatase YigB (HAD superfamily)